MGLARADSAPTDFDFVLGDWTVVHRRLRERLAGRTDWIEFDGEMSTRAVLGGYGNVEDNLLRFPEGEFRALALRSYDAAASRWSIWWLDGRFPDRIDVPVIGRFEDGLGTFYADDTLDGCAIRIRFLWSRIDADSLRWEQAFSADGGTQWETNWTMDFARRA